MSHTNYEEYELDTAELERRMDGAMHALKTEFASLRPAGPWRRCWVR